MAAFYAVGHLMAFFFGKNAHKKAQIPDLYMLYWYPVRRM